VTMSEPKFSRVDHFRARVAQAIASQYAQGHGGQSGIEMGVRNRVSHARRLDRRRGRLRCRPGARPWSPAGNRICAFCRARVVDRLRGPGVRDHHHCIGRGRSGVNALPGSAAVCHRQAIGWGGRHGLQRGGRLHQGRFIKPLRDLRLTVLRRSRMLGTEEGGPEKIGGECENRSMHR